MEYFPNKVKCKSIINFTSSAIVTALSLICFESSAQSENKNNDQIDKITENITDGENFFGDFISFDYAIYPTIYDSRAYALTDEKTCLPPRTKLKGVGVGFLSGKPYSLFRVVKYDLESDKNEQRWCFGEKSPKLDSIIGIPKQQLTTTPPTSRFGVAYGALFVPYKYYAAGNNTFSMNASVNAYLGLRITGLSGENYIPGGGDIKLAFFTGLTGATTTESEISKSDKSIIGVSVGVGLLFKAKSSIQFGFLVGRDYFNGSDNYENNRKNWLGIAVGYGSN